MQVEPMKLCVIRLAPPESGDPNLGTVFGTLDQARERVKNRQVTVEDHEAESPQHLFEALTDLQPGDVIAELDGLRYNLVVVQPDGQLGLWRMPRVPTGSTVS